MSTSRNVLRTMTSVVATALLVTLGGVAANADTTIDGAEHVVWSQTNSDCVAQVQAARAAGSTETTDQCTVTVVTDTAKAQSLAITDITNAKSVMSASEYSTFAAAAAAGTVKKKPFSQTISQITDEEKQYGTYFYDGSHVWVEQTYRGHTGTHYCVVDYAVGYDVSNTYCNDTGSTSTRTITMIWRISLAAKGSPISWSETYSLRAKANGSISQV